MERRAFITGSAGVAAGILTTRGLAAGATGQGQANSAEGAAGASSSKLKHSVCRWCYGRIPLEELSASAKAMGYESIELLGEQEWPVVQAAGLTCAVANGPTKIGDGLNNPANLAGFVSQCDRLIPLVAKAGIPSMIVFSGNRGACSDTDGLRNCAEALRQVTPLAEEQGVAIVMELLNSKVDHKGYMCDRTPWGVELVKQVGSDRFRLLYDIYHMQIMEGDVIRTIRENVASIGHFHTGGVPGRAEIDASQELQYPAICRAIADAGYSGYIGQEFIPRRDPMTSLREAIALCSV